MINFKVYSNSITNRLIFLTIKINKKITESKLKNNIIKLKLLTKIECRRIIKNFKLYRQ
jgi:hypothetical protein